MNNNNKNNKDSVFFKKLKDTATLYNEIIKNK